MNAASITVTTSADVRLRVFQGTKTGSYDRAGRDQRASPGDIMKVLTVALIIASGTLRIASAQP